VNTGSARTVLTRVAAEFEQVIASLEPLRQSFGQLAAAPGPATLDDLAALQPRIHDLLARHRGLVAGAGVVTAPGLLADAEYWLEWWWSPAGAAEPGRLRVNLDPGSPDFFDYPAEDWFATPRGTARPHVSGPSVDYACTSEYALTIALPVTAGDRFAGVAAADVLVSSLEERVLPRLRGLSPSCVLATGQGRVVASASPRFAPGLRAAPAAQRVTLPSGKTGTPGFALDWQLLDGHA
jgi:hypothetical protein